MNEKIVMYDSEEAATYRRDIEGWVDRHGIFCGKSEDLARWKGCTHRPCSKCGKPAPKMMDIILVILIVVSAWGGGYFFGKRTAREEERQYQKHLELLLKEAKEG